MEAANDTAKDQISLASLLRQVLESQVCPRAAEAEPRLSTSARLVDETEPSTHPSSRHTSLAPSWWGGKDHGGVSSSLQGQQRMTDIRSLVGSFTFLWTAGDRRSGPREPAHKRHTEI